VTRFVILAAPRTGSNLLCTLLQSCPEILCHHEIFNPEGTFFALAYRGVLDLGTPEDRDRDPLDFLRRVWGNPDGHSTLGFKWTRGQNPVVFEHVVENPSILKIVLRRRNRIKTFVSEEVSRATNRWEVYRETDLQGPQTKVNLDTVELRAHIRTNEDFYGDLCAALRAHQQTFFEVDYEDLLDLEVQQQILRFVGVQHYRVPLTAASVKQNPTDLREILHGYEDLARELRGTDLEKELCDLGM
jgi:hypothetical protein